VPLGIGAGVLGWNPLLVLALNSLAVMVLNGLAIDAVDEFVNDLGNITGGLVAAAIRNRVILIVCFQPNAQIRPSSNFD
jgi:hypothetical protein